MDFEIEQEQIKLFANYSFELKLQLHMFLF